MSRIVSALLLVLLGAPVLAQQAADVPQAKLASSAREAPILVPTTTINGVLGSGSGGICQSSGTTPSRIFRDGNPSSCGAPKAWPGWFNSGGMHYDAYTLANYTGSTQCVTISITGPSTSAHVSAYANEFSAALAPANYLGDSGSSIDGQQWSISVAAGQTVVIVVQENNANNYLGQPYALTFTHLTPGCYDRYYVDNYGRCRMWLNSTSGQWRMEVFSGPAAGLYTGQAMVSTSGGVHTLSSDPSASYTVAGTCDASTATLMFRLMQGRLAYRIYLTDTNLTPAIVAEPK